MPRDDALRFAERLLALLEATRYSATYKLATLLALIDAVAERTGADGSVPERISGKEVGRRVIELYWPQTVPYGAAADGQPRVLRQAPQNDIPAKLAAWRAAHRLGAGASLEDARAADPAGWAALSPLVAVRAAVGPLPAGIRPGDSYNRLHWVRDVTYLEDKSLVRTGNAPRVKASLRSLAISLLRLDGHANIAAANRHHAHDPQRALQLFQTA